jgi:aminodeoxychorismate synthase component I|nr:aminodeoxychorismate synthase component I [Candidatus Krumholzibacteria bacterium]
MIARTVIDLPLERPLWECAALLSRGELCFLLDSAMDPQRLGQRTYLGGQPPALLTGKREENTGAGQGVLFRLQLTRWMLPDGTIPPRPLQSTWTGDPFAALRNLQAEYGAPLLDQSSPSGFAGGLVGFFGYEVGHALESLPDTGRPDPDLPDLAFMVADMVACEDHATGRRTLTVTGRGQDQERARGQAETMAGDWQALLQEPLPPRSDAPVPTPPLRSDFDQAGYCTAVDQCREHILAGDVFEVCLTHRMHTEFGGDPWNLYRRLRESTPAPFAAYLQFGDFQILSASPERFLKLDEDRVAESRPIKGTRPRGTDPAQDAQLREDLATNEKDRAENLMIVDLVRSDLGRVAEIGSVEVPELMVVEEYATVFQLVSTVAARLRPECDALDLVKACYPGGSMTGAPKIRAMEIIDSLEPVQRGVFSGAIGYLDRSGIMDLSIVIRTIVCQDGRAHFGVGGAVTADSSPLAEYQETLDKARALARALGAALPE